MSERDEQEAFDEQMRLLRKAARHSEYRGDDDAAEACRWAESRMRHERAVAPRPARLLHPPGLLSRGQARAIHIMTNVAHARNGRVLLACDGPDCAVCGDLTLLKLPMALSRLSACQSDPPGLVALVKGLIDADDAVEHAGFNDYEEMAEHYRSVFAKLRAAYDLSVPASPQAKED